MPNLNQSNQATVWYARYTYSTSDFYQMMMVNWKCDIDASNTYWAVSQFTRNGTVLGYAGFKNDNGNHNVLLSLWNIGSNYPEVEYVSPYGRLNDLTFGSEGDGKHIVTDYPWQTNTWYTMCIGIKNVAGKTYFAQWVSEKESNEWVLCGIISYPQTSQFINCFSFFQEDFTGNNYIRQCSIQDAYGKKINTNNWTSWNNHYYIHNQNNSGSSPQENVNIDCDFKAMQNHIYFKAGGNEDSPNMDHIPDYYQISSPGGPAYSPTWPIKFTPRLIQNKNSELYMAPGNNNTVVQSATEYYWHFVDSDLGYYHILTSDHSKALAISGTSSGSDIILSNYDSNDSSDAYQRWQKCSARHSQYSHLVPFSANDMDIYVPFSSTTAGTQLKLGSQSLISSHHWFCYNTGHFYKIKSYYSSQYINYHNDSNSVYQRPRQLIWNFVDAGNGYFYILTPDNCKALTYVSDIDGTNLTIDVFSPIDTKQMWKLQTISSANNLYYIISKYNENKNIDIEGPSMQEYAYIQIWTHSDGVNSFKWYLE